jgi:hypothetical protein
VAFATALSSPGIAGVIASSAGYHDGQMRRTLPFPVFATAGTEDFNHLEMRLLDRALTSPHRLVIFAGGHTWLSSDLAIIAIEYMVVQSMKAGLVARDEETLDRILARWTAAADAAATPKDQFVALDAIVRDFGTLRDVSAIAARAEVLGRGREVRDALKADRDDDAREERLLMDIKTAETRLASPDDRAVALDDLRRQWRAIAEQARRPEDSRERRLMRRALAALSTSVTTTDPDYLAIIAQYRTGRGRQP